MEKINVAELLKDCPQGMELDCMIYENLEFDHIDEVNEHFNIVCRVKTESGYNVHTFTEHGCYSSNNYAKCVIFPKGKTTWEGVVPTCQFKDGDVFRIKSGKYYLCIRNLFDEYINIIFHKDDTYYSPEDLYLIPSNSNVPYKVEYCADEYFRIHETKTLEKMVTDKFDINTLVPFESKVLVRDKESHKWKPAIWGYYD